MSGGRIFKNILQREKEAQRPHIGAGLVCLRNGREAGVAGVDEGRHEPMKAGDGSPEPTRKVFEAPTRSLHFLCMRLGATGGL